MIAEFIQWSRSRCAPGARTLGYAGQSAALYARRKRCAVHWNYHEQQSREIILECAGQSRRKNSILIFGAGLAHELPLQNLSSIFREVHLVDIVIHPTLKKACRQFRNIHIHCLDCMNIVQHLDLWKPEHELPQPQAVLPDLADIPDMIISSNILSQLHLLPIEYIHKKMPWISSEELNSYGLIIMQEHLRLLESKLAPLTLLISDRAYRECPVQSTKAAQTVLSVPSGLITAPLLDQWIWQLAPAPEVSPHYSVELMMGAWLYE
jgi:hypothetical protein